MTPSRRRLIWILAALPLVLVSVALAYMTGMAQLEGKERSFWKALAWAAETLTTTGYGAEATWDHPGMVLFVVAFQFLGVFLVYMLVPLIMLPLLEERFELRLPRHVSKRLEDHVVILRYGPVVETLVEELLDADLSVVIVELDDDLARSLLHQWLARPRHYKRAHLVHGDNVLQGLKGARIEAATTLVANGDDEENAIAVLVAQELHFTGSLVAVVEEPRHRRPLRLAGAHAVFTPRHVLGAALASRASQRLQPRVDGVSQIGTKLRVSEIRVTSESPLIGRTLAEAELGRKTGAVVLGQWVAGQLDSNPTPDMVIVRRGLLVVIGEPAAIENLTDLVVGEHRQPIEGPIWVAGYGEVGQKVAQLLGDAGETVRVIDKNTEITSIDLHGDIGDDDVLDSLDLEHAQALVLALDSDSATLFATLIIKERVPLLPVIARVNQAQNMERLYRAGADFVLSISQVSAQILVQRLLGRDILALDAQLKIIRVSSKRLVDQHPSTLEIRKRTGCSVIAVERGDEAITSFDPDFQFVPGDRVYACGPHKAAERFVEMYGS